MRSSALGRSAASSAGVAEPVRRSRRGQLLVQYASFQRRRSASLACRSPPTSTSRLVWPPATAPVARPHSVCLPAHARTSAGQAPKQPVPTHRTPPRRRGRWRGPALAIRAAGRPRRRRHAAGPCDTVAARRQPTTWTPARLPLTVAHVVTAPPDAAGRRPATLPTRRVADDQGGPSSGPPWSARRPRRDAGAAEPARVKLIRLATGAVAGMLAPTTSKNHGAPGLVRTICSVTEPPPTEPPPPT